MIKFKVHGLLSGIFLQPNGEQGLEIGWQLTLVELCCFVKFLVQTSGCCLFYIYLAAGNAARDKGIEVIKKI